jgi:hypothetical protein
MKASSTAVADDAAQQAPEQIPPWWTPELLRRNARAFAGSIVLILISVVVCAYARLLWWF